MINVHDVGGVAVLELDQDAVNLPHVQKGMNSSAFKGLWISAQEPHYPLRLGGGNASGSGNLNFTYNVPVQVAAPNNAVDLSRGAAEL